MKNGDKKVFKQAFDELNEEGYFEDFIARVKRKRLRSTSGVKSKSGSAAAADKRVYYDKRAKR